MIQHHGKFSHVCFPAEWGDPPAFQLGQRVQLDVKNTGTVFGFDYVAVGSWEHRELIDPGWHYKVVWDECCPRAVSIPCSLQHESEIHPLLPIVQPSHAEPIAV
jgi:hypothetical protein